MSDANAPLDPIIALVLAYAPNSARAAWRWLWMLEKKINDGTARAGEPMLAQMRLAWWRERILDETSLPAQRDPMLLDLAQLVARHPRLPVLAGQLLDAMEARITAETPLQWAESLAQEGGVVANAYTELAHVEGQFSNVGRAFGCARALKSGVSPNDERWRWVRELAEEALSATTVGRLPRSLSLMRLNASQIMANPNRPARRRDGINLLIHGLTGWPKY